MSGMAQIKKTELSAIQFFRNRILRAAGQIVKCVKCEPDEPFPTLTSLSAKLASYLNLGM